MLVRSVQGIRSRTCGSCLPASGCWSLRGCADGRADARRGRWLAAGRCHDRPLASAWRPLGVAGCARRRRGPIHQSARVERARDLLLSFQPSVASPRVLSDVSPCVRPVRRCDDCSSQIAVCVFRGVCCGSSTADDRCDRAPSRLPRSSMSSSLRQGVCVHVGTRTPSRARGSHRRSAGPGESMLPRWHAR